MPEVPIPKVIYVQKPVADYLIKPFSRSTLTLLVFWRSLTGSWLSNCFWEQTAAVAVTLLLTSILFGPVAALLCLVVLLALKIAWAIQLTRRVLTDAAPDLDHADRTDGTIGT